MSAPDLVVDIGNTRIKWALARTGALVPGSQGARAHDRGLPLAHWQALRPGRLAVASVAGNPRAGAPGDSRSPDAALPDADMSARIAAALDLPVWRPRSLKHWHGLVCAYEDPAQFGVDRWLALLAARQRRPGATMLVVSAGTALTVDVLQEQAGQAWHRGGLIAPGLQAMQRGLFDAAPALRAHRGGQPRPGLAVNSADAIAGGCLQAAIGLVQAVREQWGGLSVPVLLAGGDAGQLQAHLPAPVHLVPTLVLEGLALWLQAAAC